MIRIGGLVVIIRMTSITQIRRSDIITLMAGKTIAGNCCMCADKGIIFVMDRECGRLPARICRMTGLTIGRDAYSIVVGIH